MDYPHLISVESKQQADLSNAERRLLIQKDHWYPYTRGKDALSQMEWLFNHAKTERMPNMQLIGESMSGKTRILKRFAFELHPPIIDRRNEADHRPVVYIQAPATPSAKGFLEEVLLSANIPYPSSATPARLGDQISKVFQAIGVRMLIIDEIQHLLRGSGAKQREMRDEIKLLGNRLQIAIVAAGIPEASGAFATDPQLSNRFKVFELPRWHIAEKNDIQNLMLILRAWQEGCPLRKPSELLTGNVVAKVFDNTGGLFGHIINYLKHAAEYAIDSGEECINEKTLKEMGWKVPKEAARDFVAV